MAQFEECLICHTDLEENYYGHPDRLDNAPYDLDICYGCLAKLKSVLSNLPDTNCKKCGEPLQFWSKEVYCPHCSTKISYREWLGKEEAEG